ncbi:MAG: tRNA (adenine(22)-N(1))-methyltransferase [Brotaphodocola sp.]
MKLSDRLTAIANMVPEDAKTGCVADVGTDHGFVPVWLIREKRAARAIAMDVREGPLQRAEEHIRQYGLSGPIETRLSDGLEKLMPGEADTVVIAGMGGELMLRILRDGGHVRSTVKNWVLSPQSELSAFRHGLEELGLVIVKETMLEEEGKYYTVMLAKQGQMHYDQEYEYRYGKSLIEERSQVLFKFLNREKCQYEQIVEQLKKQNSENAAMRLAELENELSDMDAAMDAMDMAQKGRD